MKTTDMENDTAPSAAFSGIAFRRSRSTLPATAVLQSREPLNSRNPSGHPTSRFAMRREMLSNRSSCETHKGRRETESSLARRWGTAQRMRLLEKLGS